MLCQVLGSGNRLWSLNNVLISGQPSNLTQQKLKVLTMVIVGGETGPGARPMHPDWPRKVRDDCEAAGVPLFFKSWGDWAPSWDGGDHLVYLDGSVIKNYHEHPDAGKIAIEPVWRIGKKRAGHLLDGKEYRGYPE